MKVRIQRDDDATFLERVRDEVFIRRRRSVNFTRVHGVQPGGPQNGRRTSRDALVEEELHALFGRSSTRSSSIVAA